MKNKNVKILLIAAIVIFVAYKFNLLQKVKDLIATAKAKLAQR